MMLPAQSGQERRCPRRLPSRGFTLLEIVLASLLMAMVLAAIWEVLGVYSHLFEAGGIQARNAQFLTAIERQFTDDLQSAMEDSPHANGPLMGTAAGGSGNVRRFGLQGSATTLRFDVLETLPEDQLPTHESALPAAQGAGLKPQAPELKTIVYRFTPDRNALKEFPANHAIQDEIKPSADEPVAGPGLTRWEIDFETPVQSTTGVKRSMREPKSDASFENLIAQGLADDATTCLPEVRWAAFRYFDGQTWSDSWNSLQRGSLPMAVEVRLILRDPAEKDRAESSKKTSTTASDDLPVLDKPAALASYKERISPDEGPPTCRILIRLPTARKRPELKTISTFAAGEFSEKNPPIVPPPAPLPRFGPPAENAAENPHTLPDQWLRTAP